MVRIRISPGLAFTGRLNSEGETVLIAHPPIIGKGLRTVYPPVTQVLASLQQSSKPFII